jgi:hypothetical protein
VAGVTLIGRILLQEHPMALSTRPADVVPVPVRVLEPRNVDMLTPRQRKHLTALRRMARTMDARWGIGPARIGFDSILGLIPVVGDVSSAASGLYIQYVAQELGVPARTRLRMALTTGFDLLLGLVPVAGDLADMILKANMRNVRLIEKHLERAHRPAPSRRR